MNRSSAFFFAFFFGPLPDGISLTDSVQIEVRLSPSNISFMLSECLKYYDLLFWPVDFFYPCKILWQLKPINLTLYQNTTSLSVFVRVQ